MSYRLAILGSSGSVGTRVVLLALKKGYTVLAIDIVPPTPDPDRDSNPNFRYVCVDLRDYEKVVGTLEEWRPCDGVIQLAAKPGPGDFVVEAHNTCVLIEASFYWFDRSLHVGCELEFGRNVVISWNVLRAAAAVSDSHITYA
jgi:nucleoside-diphosphate-sugar epimerase